MTTGRDSVPGRREYFGVDAAAEVAAQHLADRGHRLHGIDPALGTRQSGDRPGVVAEVGADVDADVARADELRQVVDILRGASRRPMPSRCQRKNIRLTTRR